MFQGTASNVGKSMLTAAFCRIFLEDGYSVAPFKAQNLALNSFVTKQGLEMGRAQALQAAACRIEPDVRMNPVLLKPDSDTGSQVIVMGKPVGSMKVRSYDDFKKELKTIIADSYNYLSSNYDIVVIEGAGSPAEVNLKKADIANMYVAKMAQCPVIIVGDIDRGGVYAHFAGTFDLLDEDERQLTAGFLINKFRGDASQLKPANDFIEQRTKRKLFGVIPMLPDLKLPDEDSVEFKKQVGKQKPQKNKMNIALVDLPHISNFTDFDAFHDDPDVNLYVTADPADLEEADMILLPGSKNTIFDIIKLRAKGFPVALARCVAQGKTVVGICGGFQMLGKRIADPGAVESAQSEIEGFGFLDMVTIIEEEKRLTQVNAFCVENGLQVKGYEIHHGRSSSKEATFLEGTSGEILGCRNTAGNVWGTYIHGIFDEVSFRDWVLNKIRKKKGMPLLTGRENVGIDAELSRLASVVREHTDMEAIYRCLLKSR
ncbi:MAG: cobyric acid synthase [bacterium]|nr:cobyric acid synthase [bacterium]